MVRGYTCVIPLFNIGFLFVFSVQQQVGLPACHYTECDFLSI